MRAYATGDSPWSKRMRDWLAANDGLRSHVLEELEERGPLASRDFEDRSARPWEVDRLDGRQERQPDAWPC